MDQGAIEKAMDCACGESGIYRKSDGWCKRWIRENRRSDECCKQWIREQWKERWLVRAVDQRVIEGAMDGSWRIEGAMDGSWRIEGAMSVASDGSGSNGRSDGWCKRLTREQ